VLIKVLRTGLCGTDLHIQSWDPWAQKNVPVPMVTGHEFCGEVVEIGAGVRDVAVGDLVSGEGHLVCGRCRNCRAGRRHLCIRTQGIGVNRDGAFADLVVMPAANAWVQPPGLDPDLGAVFDPLGNATHTALQWPMVGEDVVITGAGPIGVMAAAIARHAGARYVVVTDASDYRLALAEHAGADLTINVTRESLADAQAHLGMKEGFDIGLEMSGAAPAVRDLIANMNHGGRIALLGLPHQSYDLDWGKVITHMITLKGIYGREMYDTWYAMSQMIATSERFRSAVTQVITHRFPAEHWEEAFQTARSGQCGKVLLDWS
jgi:threonine 3-dehydrogenase